MKPKRTNLTWERLVEVLHYEPTTGDFTWLKTLSSRAVAGTPAKNISPTTGSVRIRIDGELYAAHRLAWLYVHKVFPMQLIDHKDLNRANNKLSNLREADHAQNSHNYLGHGALNTKGVYLVKVGKPYRASIMCRGKKTHLGSFNTLEEASAIYQAASRAQHKEFSPFKEQTNERK